MKPGTARLGGVERRHAGAGVGGCLQRGFSGIQINEEATSVLMHHGACPVLRSSIVTQFVLHPGF